MTQASQRKGQGVLASPAIIRLKNSALTKIVTAVAEKEKGAVTEGGPRTRAVNGIARTVCLRKASGSVGQGRGVTTTTIIFKREGIPVNGSTHALGGRPIVKRAAVLLVDSGPAYRGEGKIWAVSISLVTAVTTNGPSSRLAPRGHLGSGRCAPVAANCTAKAVSAKKGRAKLSGSSGLTHAKEGRCEKPTVCMRGPA